MNQSPTPEQTDPSPGTVGACLLLACTVLAAYAPVVTAHYGFADDFTLFTDHADGINVYLSAGRPLGALRYYLIDRHAESLMTLNLLRTASVVGLAGLAVLFYLQAKRFQTARKDRFALALGLVTLPSLQVLAAYATCGFFPLGALAAASAGVILLDAFTGPSRSPLAVCVRVIAAPALILTAISLYQPLAMWFWVVVLIGLLDEKFLAEARYRRGALLTIAVGLALFVLSFFLLKGLFLLTDMEAQSRFQLVRHPLVKLHALLRVQLPLALNLWRLAEPAQKLHVVLTSAATATAILLGYVLSTRRTIRMSQGGTTRLIALRTALIGLVAACSHAHWLAVDVSPINYRIVGALAGAVFVAWYWAMLQIVRSIPRPRWRAAIQTGLPILVMVTGFLACRHQLQKYWTQPYSTGYRFVVESLQDELKPDTVRIHVIRQGPDDGIVSERIVYSFGRPLTDPEWVPEGLVRAALAESGVEHQVERITHGLAAESVPTDPRTLLLDMRRLQQFRRHSKNDEQTGPSLP